MLTSRGSAADGGNASSGSGIASRIASDAIPSLRIESGGYRVSFARTPAEIDAALRLRFRVFNVELDEGLEESWKTGRDVDRFDAYCHHLIVTDRATGGTIGTYRMQTAAMAARHEGFYSDGEFVLAALGAGVLENSVEVGRACIAREHRRRQVLTLLWRGLAAYMSHHGKRYLFGCCSLTGQNAGEGLRLLDQLRRDGMTHPELVVPARPGWDCVEAAGEGAREPHGGPDIPIPPLFGLYLKLGALVCGGPALDRQFGTIDYLVLLDLETLGPASRAMFFR